MHETQTLKFWQDRITKHSQDGPGHPDLGFDKVDPIHKKIITKFIDHDNLVLDVGCGVGRIADWFDYYTGVDFVPEFIYEAISSHFDRTFVLADIKERLPFVDKQFDWAIMVSCSLPPTTEVKRVAKNILELAYGNPEKYNLYTNI